MERFAHVDKLNGLELAAAFYHNLGQPMLEEHFAPYLGRIAVGLVGDGSECLGFDDDISRDHDWGPAFCLWLTDEDYAAIGEDLQQAYDSLDPSILGWTKRTSTPEAAGRVGAMTISGFYRRFTGLERLPETIREWRAIPESYLATATNGKVFADQLGRFTAIRQGLLNFYPEDVRIKKIAARAAIMAQSGQYNYSRCAQRGEWVAAASALAEFANKTCSMIHLLNKRYTPFYKWMHRSLLGLPKLAECHGMLLSLCDGSLLSQAQGNVYASSRQAEAIIEQICALVLLELQAQGLAEPGSSFLIDHCPEIISHIEDSALRAAHHMLD